MVWSLALEGKNDHDRFKALDPALQPRCCFCHAEKNILGVISRYVIVLDLAGLTQNPQN
jgi:hypothetical protein